MATPDDGNGRITWLKDDRDYIKDKLDELVKSNEGVCATVRTHSFALRLLFGIVGSLVVILIAFAVGAR